MTKNKYIKPLYREEEVDEEKIPLILEKETPSFYMEKESKKGTIVLVKQSQIVIKESNGSNIIVNKNLFPKDYIFEVGKEINY